MSSKLNGIAALLDSLDSVESSVRVRHNQTQSVSRLNVAEIYEAIPSGKMIWRTVAAVVAVVAIVVVVVVVGTRVVGGTVVVLDVLIVLVATATGNR